MRPGLVGRAASVRAGDPAGVHLGGNVLLAPGAGYDLASGSALVRALQIRLMRAGARPGPVDGRYGPLTEQAVIRFQAAHGLVVDGIAGPVTLAALTSPTPVLYPGAGYGQPAGSPLVRSLQRHLSRLGIAPGPIDGRYGPLTTHAVERFQRGHGLVADGIFGPRTGRAMAAALGRAVARTRHHITARGALHPRRRIQHRRPAKRVPKVVHPVRRIPSLPVGVVLLAIAALGLATAVVSYKRTRTKLIEARADALARNGHAGRSGAATRAAQAAGTPMRAGPNGRPLVGLRRTPDEEPSR